MNISIIERLQWDTQLLGLIQEDAEAGAKLLGVDVEELTSILSMSSDELAKEFKRDNKIIGFLLPAEDEEDEESEEDGGEGADAEESNIQKVVNG